MPGKEQLRGLYLTKRKTITPEDLSRKSEYLLSIFSKSFDLVDFKNVHVFLPIKKQNEVNTWPFISHVKDENSNVIISKSDLNINNMSHYFYDDNVTLEENKWGIPEPVSGTQVSELEIDMVLVPLVVFDKSGHRIGYGKGYYDKFLSRCRPDCKKVGLSLLPPLDSMPDIESTDVKLDYCISPIGLHTFEV